MDAGSVLNTRRISNQRNFRQFQLHRASVMCVRHQLTAFFSKGLMKPADGDSLFHMISISGFDQPGGVKAVQTGKSRIAVGQVARQCADLAFLREDLAQAADF